MNDRELMQQALDSLEAAYHPNDEVGKVMDAIKERLAQPEPEQTRSQKLRDAGITRRPKGWDKDGDESECRDDGRCQYAIDHGAEGVGHCPEGKCCMPKAQPESDEDYEALANKQLASLKEDGKKTFEDAAVRALNKLYNTEPEHVHANDMSEERVHKTEKNKHEPVAWMEFERFMDEDGLMSERKVLYTWDPCRGEPLYTAPPQREWVGLTDEEISIIWGEPIRVMYSVHYKSIQEIQAKLKEKNGG